MDGWTKVAKRKEKFHLVRKRTRKWSEGLMRSPGDEWIYPEQGFQSVPVLNMKHRVPTLHS